MATPFARTLRTLDADSLTPTLVVLVVALALLVGWLGWFFFGSITLYATSTTATLAADGTLSASFAARDGAQLRRGQRAFLHLNPPEGTAVGAVPAIMTAVERDPQQATVQTQFVALWDDAAPIAPQDGLQGRIAVELEYVSPAMLLMRTVGQYADTPQVQTSPQNREQATP